MDTKIKASFLVMVIVIGVFIAIKVNSQAKSDNTPDADHWETADNRTISEFTAPTPVITQEELQARGEAWLQENLKGLTYEWASRQNGEIELTGLGYSYLIQVTPLTGNTYQVKASIAIAGRITAPKLGVGEEPREPMYMPWLYSINMYQTNVFYGSNAQFEFRLKILSSTNVENFAILLSNAEWNNVYRYVDYDTYMPIDINDPMYLYGWKQYRTIYQYTNIICTLSGQFTLIGQITI